MSFAQTIFYFFGILLLDIYFHRTHVLCDENNVKHALSCENEKMKLNCPNGQVINVLDGNYGRTSSSACKKEPIRSVTCYQNNTASIVTDLCEGLSECTVDANNKVFGDPCEGTVKYLFVLYHCVSEKEFKQSLGCENRPLLLECDPGRVIQIHGANYGRRTQVICTEGPISSTNCFIDYAVDIVSRLCNNKRTCTVMATNNVFGDPCFGTHKYLSVQYKCVPVPDAKHALSCENEKMKLNCPNGKIINILDGNYGRTSASACMIEPIRSVTCYQNNTVSIVTHLCEGRSECTVDANNKVFGDPCAGTVKYLLVLYHCVSEKGITMDDYCPVIEIENGQYGVLGQGYRTKTPIPNYALVRLSCNANYTLYPATPLIACNNGSWNMPIPQCRLTCPPRVSSSMNVNCTVDGIAVDCSQPLVEGTVARSSCKRFYAQSDYDIPISTCIRGSWSNPPVRCVPECGEVVSIGGTNIVNGTNVKKGEFPWHIGLYRLHEEKHEYQCGGTIINPQIIITAAHCFTDESGLRYPQEEFYVAAGKYYSDYNSVEDIYAQKRQVKEYYIPSKYQGYAGNFAGDLAVVIVRTIFELSNVVQPVCMDWDDKIGNQQLKHNNRGSVVGWGFVDPNIPKASKELKQLNPLYIDLGQCLDEVPSNFRRWVTLDKFCAGFRNGSSLCKGDSGGGLVFKWNNKEKFYLRGVVSVGPIRNGVCDNFQYGVYTKVSYYSEFILNIININTINNN